MNLEFPKKYLTTILVVLLFIVSGIFNPEKSLAQLDQSISTPEDIIVDISPQNPAPGETVIINLNSYTVDVNSSKIDWVVNGKNILSGIGKKTYSVVAPAAGSKIDINITVVSGLNIIKTNLVIKPTITVMLWEADDSYVPPFYKGKALPVADSKIRVVVMPEIKTSSGYINPKNMTYSWRQDYTNDQEASGYGKNSFSYISDYLDTSNLIEVSASTTDQAYTTSGSLNIGTYQPKLVFYLNDENIGTRFERSLGSEHTIKDKAILFAAPYFIAPKDIRNPRLVWYWSINGQTIPTEILRKNLLPIQARGGVSGTSLVKLEIENLDKIFQTASGAININF